MGSQPYNPYDPRYHHPGSSLSGPHAPRDDPGACYPPPTYPFATPAYGPAPASGGFALPHTSKLSIPGFKMNQTVNARITTDTWVMGVIIGVVHICSKITGRAYVVEFESINGRRERREFSNEELRPYQPGG